MLQNTFLNYSYLVIKIMIGKANKRILITDYDQEVEAWSEVKGVYGQPTIKTKLFTGLAKVEELSGSKALQYNQQGIINPVLIEMNWMDTLPSYIMWEDRKIPVISFVDPDNHMKRRVVILGSFIKTHVVLPDPDPGLWTEFNVLGDGWSVDDNTYDCDGTQSSTSFLTSDVVLEAGEVYLVDITGSETLGTGGFLAFLNTTFSDPINDLVVQEGTFTKELTAVGGVVAMNIAATTRITFKINSIFKKVV